MDEEWSRDAKAQPDCLDSSHQRIPRWRKEPVTEYFSSMQRSPAALATGKVHSGSGEAFPCSETTYLEFMSQVLLSWSFHPRWIMPSLPPFYHL